VPRDPRVSSSVVEYKPSGTAHAPDASVPAQGSVESELLDLLKLPPDTPVIGLRQPAPAEPHQSVNRQAVQRAPVEFEDTTDEPPQISPAQTQAPLQRREVTVQNALQRESSDDNSGQQAEGTDVEALARKVYSIIRERLRIERERRDR
jgi:hypothetical protein